MDKDFKIEVLGMGINATRYPGAFSPTVNRIITETIQAEGWEAVLHLFSGTSNIGLVRVDLAREEATDKGDVYDFIAKNTRPWECVILDPPYAIKRKKKINDYACSSDVASDVNMRRALDAFFAEYADNVIWLDMCAPFPKKVRQAGFKRKKLWFLLPGGYRTVRVLSWLHRETSK